MLDLFSLEYIWLFPVAVLISMFASIIGIGGGLLWAPFFIFIFKMDLKEAAIYSFAVQIAGMASASIYNISKKQIYWVLVVLLLPMIIAGELAGAYLNQIAVDSSHLQGAMGVMSILVSLVFAFQHEKYHTALAENRKLKPPLWLAALCVPFGMLSGLFSVGIGDNLVPLFRGRLKIPMKNAVGTTLFLNFVISILGVIFHTQLSSGGLHSINFSILAMCWPGVLLGGQLGPTLGNKIADTRLKEIFIFILLLIGIHLIYKSI